MRSDGGSIDPSPTIDQAINDGLPGHQLGKKTRVLVVDLIAWVRTWDG
jgi:hypothetical protein